MKVLISLPDDLHARMLAVIPKRRRSKIIAEILKREIEKREQELYITALAVERDERLNAEMADWDVTVGDGIETETW
jgi:hypothetical protein